MRSALIIALALLCGAAAHAAEDRWTGQDKAMHFGVSAVLGFAASNQWPDQPLKAWAWATVPGLLKEISDSQRGGTRFSGKDLAVDALGAAVGVGGHQWLITRTGNTTTVALMVPLK